jgi:hypothetical protein
MKSLRTILEESFAAAAFAEANLGRDAREVLGEAARTDSVAQPQRREPARRQRPTLKA